MYLSHAFELEGPMIVNEEKTIRGYLRDWTFNIFARILSYLILSIVDGYTRRSGKRTKQL